jgi:hypothetical protein
MRGVRRVRAAMTLVALLTSCQSTIHRADFARVDEPKKIDTTAPFLKCHLRNGDLYVLEKWNVDMEARTVSGTGLHYDAVRDLASETPAPQRVALEDVVLFETNRPEIVHHPEIWGMMIVTVGSLALTGVCAASPKTCFGSCPTFYPDAESESDAIPEAEGFSASIARVLEATDVDAMWTTRPRGTDFTLVMRNEALETHVVDHVRLLAAKRPPHGRVLRAGATFYPSAAMHAPRSCRAPSGDCTEAVRATDGREWTSPASATDLAEEETIELAFPRPRARAHGKTGVLVVARNSLLNTFVLYQMLAYMGDDVGTWFAKLEREGKWGKELGAAGPLSALSDIQVDVETGTGWKRAGTYSEVGPIAREAQVVPLPDDLAGSGDDVHVRLRAARGNWKLEQIALAELDDPVTPIAIDPDRVVRDGKDDADALAKLLRPGERLVAMPGDKMKLHFVLPDVERELFLESRGYYYEWMRPEWLKEKKAAEVLAFFFAPDRTLRKLAPQYKALEGRMDEAFWKSRFGGGR